MTSNVKVVFARCTAAEVLEYLRMSNEDIKQLGDITVLQLLEDAKRVGSVIVPYRGNQVHHGR